MKKRITIIAIGVVSFVGLAGLYGAAVYQYNQSTAVQPVVEAPDAPQLRQDPQLVAAMQELGLPTDNLNLEARSGGYKGSFVSPNSIQINTSNDRKTILVSLSHEYLHYIQFTQPAEAGVYYSYTKSLIDSDPAFRVRMTNYINGVSCGGTCNLSFESEAIACTEVPDYVLRTDFIAFCNKYINRAKLGL